MKLTEKELKRLAILVAREINGEESYLLTIDQRIKELKTIHEKITKEIDRKEFTNDRKEKGTEIKETISGRA